MFKIPEEHDINLLTKEQKKELENALNTYESYYIINNKLSDRFKTKISLEKYLNIKYNLLNSTTLLGKITNKEIEINKLPWLDPYELDETQWKIYIDKRDKKRDTIEKMATVNIFKCRKCGEMKCTSYQLQTASIDEPMTTFINCKVCGNSWKV
jgi:DNA-directed RNA polymerase subunit M/transcription elongation factor TFIIS